MVGKIAIMISAGDRLVYFGYIDNCADMTEKTLKIYGARRALQWSRTIGGIGGLALVGPNEHCLIEAQVPWQIVHDVRVVRGVTKEAEARWLSKKPVS